MVGSGNPTGSLLAVLSRGSSADKAVEVMGDITIVTLTMTSRMSHCCGPTGVDPAGNHFHS